MNYDDFVDVSCFLIKMFACVWLFSTFGFWAIFIVPVVLVVL